MKNNEILFITFSNTLEDIKNEIKKHTDACITIRANNWELTEEIEDIIGRDRPRAIIYDGDFPVSEHLKCEHEKILTYHERYDVPINIYSFGNLLPLPGIKLLSIKKLKKLVKETKEPN